ncbi:MAG: carbon-nitrogen hydrolase family protein [Rubripirellula sp.]
MLLTCVQSDVTFADIPANIQRVLSWLDTAPVQNSDLVVFPECMLSGYAYDSRDDALPHAMELNDSRFDPLIEAAARHDLNLTLGFLERAGDLLFNAYALFGPEGMIGHYRKIHLPHLGIDRFVDRGEPR